MYKNLVNNGISITNLNWWAGSLNHQQYLHIPHLSLRKKTVVNLQGFAYNFCTTMVKTGAQRCVHVFGIFSWVKHVWNIGSWDNFLFGLERLRFLKLTKKSVVYIRWLFCWMMVPGRRRMFFAIATSLVMFDESTWVRWSWFATRPAPKKVVIDHRNGK